MTDLNGDGDFFDDMLVLTDFSVGGGGGAAGAFRGLGGLSGVQMLPPTPVDPAVLGRVLMHEHLHCDMYDWRTDAAIAVEMPMTAVKPGERLHR